MKLIINREKDRHARPIIEMDGKSTFIIDPKAPCK